MFVYSVVCIDFSFSGYKLDLNVTYGNVFTQNIIWNKKKRERIYFFVFYYVKVLHLGLLEWIAISFHISEINSRHKILYNILEGVNFITRSHQIEIYDFFPLTWANRLIALKSENGQDY